MDLIRAEKIIRETQQYAKTILNSLSAHIAIIDKHGMILETNVAWRQFASCNELGMRLIKSGGSICEPQGLWVTDLYGLLLAMKISQP